MIRRFPLALASVLVLVLTVAGDLAAQTKYSVDGAHSNIGFSVPILNGVSKVRGKFTDFKIDLDYNDTDITKSSVNAVIKATSVDTGIERRDVHLRNQDFFDVEKFPEITFQSSRIEKKGKDFVATGTFTMHGVSKEIQLPFMANGSFVNEANGTKLLGFTANLNINRRDYGMTYKNANVPNFVGDVVHIELTVLLRSQPPK